MELLKEHYFLVKDKRITLKPTETHVIVIKELIFWYFRLLKKEHGEHI